MESQELLTLATNAEQNYWPPHLGVITDAEKIDYLARQLRDAAFSSTAELEMAENRLEAMEGETLDLEHKIDRLEDENEKLKTENEELKAKLA